MASGSNWFHATGGGKIMENKHVGTSGRHEVFSDLLGDRTDALRFSRIVVETGSKTTKRADDGKNISLLGSGVCNLQV